MKKAIAFLFLLLIAATAQAEDWGIPASLTFHEAPLELTFQVKNDGMDAQPVSALITVVDYRIIGKPPLLNAGDAGEIRLKLLPRNDLVGSTYTSILTVSVGEKEMRRELKLTFEKAGEAEPAPNGGQKQEAEALIEKLNETGQKVVTELRPFESFYEAEDYHRQYYLKNSSAPYCQMIISPKLENLKREFYGLLKASEK